MASAKGVVVDTQFDSKKGTYILIKHNNLFASFYSHLKTVSVKVGDPLKKGQLIGYSGNSGSFSTGPHLHYEVIKNEKQVDPQDYFPKK
jgi:murein DD-endopeptidase MepM/ murein hydrolase activator NlpD